MSDKHLDKELIIGAHYRHFKGQEYKVLLIAFDSEVSSDESFKKIVVYQALNGDQHIWTRSYDSFISLVDHDKYPDIKQPTRFELIK